MSKPRWTIRLPDLHPAQAQIKNEAQRFNVVDCGRRFGKTTMGQDLLVPPALEGYPVGWFSPTYKMLLEVWRAASSTLKPVAQRVNAQERRIETITGGVVEMWSLDNPDAARGRKYARVVVDEAAMVKNLLDAWNMVLRPTLVDLQGDAWFFSTPKGMNGFWQMYQWGIDPERTDWACWQFPSDANPYIPASEIEAMRRSLPERVFAQEILATFLEDAGGVFRHVMDAATGSEQGYNVNHQYVFGVDWGKLNDFTVICVLDLNDRAQVYQDRFNQIDYAVQVGRLKALYERYKPVTVIAESNSMGEPLIETLAREGIPVRPFLTTNATKTAAIDGLALAFERGEIQILNDPVTIAELQAYEAERLPAGSMRYGAPEGMHDDVVMALALAWTGVGRESFAAMNQQRTIHNQWDVTGRGVRGWKVA